jgi:hypothetical protein
VPSPANSKVFVTINPTCLGLPVFPIFKPWRGGRLFTLAGVSPFAICQAMVPLFMSYAVIRPYGGLMMRKPCNVGSCAPPPLL